MSDARWSRLKEIFARAADMDEIDRAAFLDEQCAGDPELRAEVERLIAKSARAGDFLEQPVALIQDPTQLLRESHLFVEGDILAGRFAIETLLGVGGMGEVYRAFDRRLRRPVAIKVLPRHLTDEPGRQHRFEQEAQAVAALEHPNICSLYDFDREDGRDFIVLEYLEGESLSARLKRGPLAEKEWKQVAGEITAALIYAHSRGVIHRDVKPGNIMLTSEGAKLLDFGLAKRALSVAHHDQGESTMTASTLKGSVVGTVAYMSPEQAEGKPVDARSDIFSFGCVLYEMVTGQKAFHGDTLVSTLAAILRGEPKPILELAPLSPPELSEILKRCFRKSPEDRFATVSELRAAIGRIGERVDGRRTKRRTRWLVAACALLAVSLFSLVLLGRYITFNGRVEGSAGRQSVSTAIPVPGPQPRADLSGGLIAKALDAAKQPPQPSSQSHPKSNSSGAGSKSKGSEALPPPKLPPVPSHQTQVPEPAPVVNVPQPSAPEPASKARQTSGIMPEPDSEAADWARLNDSKNPEAVLAFLLKYPNGKQAHEASRLLQRLEWDRLGNANDPVVFEQYAARFPNGEFSADAVSRSRQLRAKTEESRIREALGVYVSAYNGRDTEGIRRVWVSLSEADLEQYRQTFRARALTFRLDCRNSPSFTAGAWPPDAAVVQCQRFLDMTPDEGRKPEAVDDIVTVRLQRQGVEWKILSLAGQLRRGN